MQVQMQTRKKQVATITRTHLLQTIINHTCWSTLHVAARYLQVYAQPKVFNGQGVLASTKGFAAVVVFTMSSLKSWWSLSSITQHTTTAKEVLINANENRDTNKDVTTTNKSMKQQIIYATIFSIVATTRALSNIASAKYTYPYNLALIANTSPVITAIFDKLFLSCEYPPILWHTAIVTVIAGSIIAISQSMTANNSSSSSSDGSIDGGSSSHDENIHRHDDNVGDIGVVTPTQNLIGCTLQLLSVIFSALSRILIKHTEHILSETHIVQVNNLSGCVLPFIITLIYSQSSWKAFAYLLRTPKSLLAWSTISIVVYSYASIQQVGLVRQLGPGFYSSWAACRLLGTLALSALCLGEGIGSIVEWVGVIILVVTMTVYMNETSKWIDGCKNSSRSTSNEQQQQKDDDDEEEEEEEDFDTLDDDGDEELVSINSREVKPLL